MPYKHAVWNQPGCPSDKDGGCWMDECHSDPDVPCCVRPLMLWVPAVQPNAARAAHIDWDAFMHKASANALVPPACSLERKKWKLKRERGDTS